MPESPFGAEVGQKPGLEIWRIEVRRTKLHCTNKGKSHEDSCKIFVTFCCIVTLPEAETSKTHQKFLISWVPLFAYLIPFRVSALEAHY